MARRARPFAIVAVLTAVICIAVIRLPDTFLALLERNSPFTTAQTGWAYRLLAFAAVVQALYGGFVLLRPDHVEQARRKDTKLAATPRAKLVGIVARTAASMILMTLVYGLAAFGISGQRGGFWLFPVLAVAQGAWYYRQVGQIGRWMGFQPESGASNPARAMWQREPADYCPPLARGLRTLARTDADR
jgi:hypothetical protein